VRVQLSAVNKTLLVLTLVLIALSIQFSPLAQYSSAITSFGGVTARESSDFVQSGHSDVSRRGEVILPNLEVITAEVVHPSSPFGDLATPFLLCLTFGSIVLLFAENPVRRARLTLGVAVSVVSFTLFANPDIITRLNGWNGPFAWLFMFAALYVILFKKPTRSMIALSLVFLIAIVLTYFTEAIFVAVVLGVAAFYGARSKRPIVSTNITLVYVVFLLAWLLYMSVYGFESIVNMAQTVAAAFQEESRTLGLVYIGGGSQRSFFLNALATGLASIPLLYFLLRGRKLIDHKAGDVPIIGFLALALLSVFFYAWMGLTGVVQRIPVYTMLFSIIALALLSTSKITRSHLAVLMAVALVAVGVSSFTYVTSEYNGTKITFAEAGGTAWLMEHSSPERYIFTDLRLSGPFVAENYPTIGINDIALSPVQVNSLLEKLLYEKGSPPAGLQELQNTSDVTITYLFLSDRYTQSSPGFQGYDYVYKPAPIDYLAQYYRLPQFNVIYGNTDIAILQVNSTARPSS